MYESVQCDLWMGRPMGRPTVETGSGTGGPDTPGGPTAPELARRGTFPGGALPEGPAGRRRPALRRVWGHVRVALALVVAMAVPGLVVLALQPTPAEQGPTGTETGSPAPQQLSGAPITPPDAEIDVDGDGTADDVRISAGRVEVVTTGGPAVYTVGGADDQIVVGDWDCDGRATPLLYRPAEGVVHRYDAWPTVDEPGRPVTESAPADGTARRRDDGACHVLVVE